MMLWPNMSLAKLEIYIWKHSTAVLAGGIGLKLDGDADYVLPLCFPRPEHRQRSKWHHQFLQPWLRLLCERFVLQSEVKMGDA